MKVTTLIILIAFAAFSWKMAVAIVPVKISGKNLPGGNILEIFLTLVILGTTIMWAKVGETLVVFYQKLSDIVFSMLGVEKDSFALLLIAAVAIFFATRYFLSVGNLPKPQSIKEAGLNLATIILLFVLAAPIAEIAGDSLISAIPQAESFLELAPLKVLTEFLE